MWRTVSAALSIAFLASSLNFLGWRLWFPAVPAPTVTLPLGGIAFNGFQRWQSPLERRLPSVDELARDVTQLAQWTTRLRTYSSAEQPELPRLAETLGLHITAGVWLDADEQRNRAEVDAAAAAARSPAVHRFIVGNETLLHGLWTAKQLLPWLQAVRERTGKPVSTAEPWHIWLAHPELAEAVDFIAVHLLPYWEGVPAAVAVDAAWERYTTLQARFPNKPIVIAEVGWPSSGPDIHRIWDGRPSRSSASPLEQAQFLRAFVARAQSVSGSASGSASGTAPVDYYLLEAYDQPWKTATEGEVGAHWGLFDAHRHPKLSWQGRVESDPYWRRPALLASGSGLLLSAALLIAWRHLRWSAAFALAAGAQLLCTLAVSLGRQPLVDYLRLLDGLLWGFLVLALVFLVVHLVTQWVEFVELFWDGALRRRAEPIPWPAGSAAPVVSIHLACSNEPPALVLHTLETLRKLRWPALEVLVVDNNTRDPALWQPVDSAVRQWQAQGDLRMQFHHLPQWPGFKGGALNWARTQTSPQAEWIAVVDADYAVDPDWLESVLGHALDPDVAIIQCPQAHRQWEQRWLWAAMNWEFEGFFRLGMHHRQERNAMVHHGTMTLIRRTALDSVGGWSEDCLCEDTELGLRLLQAGWKTVYVDAIKGRGLVPRDFAAYRRQRMRWAQGGVQILRHHLRSLLGFPSPSHRLAWAQRYHFWAGWLPWCGDALHGAFTVTAVAWTLAWWLQPHRVPLPTALWAMPLMGLIISRWMLGPLLYRRRVTPQWGAILSAAWAGMALTHAAGMGVWRGVAGQKSRFDITTRTVDVPSQGQSPTTASPKHGWWRPVRAELVLGSLLVGSALAASTTGGALGWAMLLACQALPYGAALTMAWASRER